MMIWVDADSCPVRIREIICKAACRVNIEAVFVANRKIPLPQSHNIKTIITDNTEQSADLYIIENAACSDIVVTRDIPLAKVLVEKNITVINDRGVLFTYENINTLLSSRNFMYQLAMNGLTPEKTSSFGKREIQKFANCFDSQIQKMLKKNSHSY